jgi:hypothetical protein
MGVELLIMLHTFVHAFAGTSAKQHWVLQGKEVDAVSLLLLSHRLGACMNTNCGTPAVHHPQIALRWVCLHSICVVPASGKCNSRPQRAALTLHQRCHSLSALSDPFG